jgi:hypothetical protein
MNVTVMNLTAVETPIVCTQGEGFVDRLMPGAPYAIDNTACTVVTIGDNPTLRDDFAEFFSELTERVIRALTFWRQHAPREGSKPEPVVRVNIENRSTVYGVRVLQGDDRSLDIEIVPGEIARAEGVDYIQVRELGA